MVESAPKTFMPILFSLNRYYNVYNVKKFTVKVNFGGKIIINVLHAYLSEL